MHTNTYILTSMHRPTYIRPYIYTHVYAYIIQTCLDLLDMFTCIYVLSAMSRLLWSFSKIHTVKSQIHTCRAYMPTNRHEIYNNTHELCIVFWLYLFWAALDAHSLRA